MKNNLWIFATIGFLLVYSVTGLPQPNNEDEAEDDYQLEDPERNQADDDDDSGPPPILMSRNETYVFDVGSNARLPCKIENPKSATVMWWMGKGILWTDSISMLASDHKNFKLGDDHSLIINNITVEDSATYKCEVVHSGDTQLVEHIVEVAVPPKIIRIVPEGSKKVIEKDTPLTLMCEAAGYPKPEISWTKKTKHGEEKLIGSVIRIDMVNRKHNGMYECKAFNNKGEFDTKTIEIHVLYAPEIEIESDVIHAGEGYESELTCVIHSEPKAKVTWLKDDQPIAHGHNRITFPDKGNKRIIRISGTQKSDFGVYRCTANNQKGTSSKTITLTGKPAKPTFLAADSSTDGKSPILSWVIDSFAPITEYELLYREQDNSDWKSSEVSVQPSNNNKFTAMHTLTGLKPRAYQAQLRAKNDFGWSELSDPHTFFGSVVEKTPHSETGLLESAPSQENSSAAELRISFALILSLLLARFYC